MSRTGLRNLALLLALVISLGAIRLIYAAPVQQPRSPSEMEKEMETRRMKEANKKRQDEIRSDTDRLFQLATELKAAVDKSNENLLSLDVVRKADEVEKLAKRVKEKMKESVAPALKVEPVPRSPYPHPPR